MTDLYVQVHYIINGVVYKKSGWFGCQLKSREWIKPKHGWMGERIIAGEKFYPFSVVRKGLKYEICWSLVKTNRMSLEDVSTFIRAFYAKLERGVSG